MSEKDGKKSEEDLEAVSYNSEEGKSKWGKIFLTAAIVASYICLACYRSIVGPTSMNLASIVNATATSIPIVYTMRSIGYITGFILGGLFLDRVKSSYYRQLLVIAMNVLAALTAIAIPFCKNLVHLGMTFLVAGVSLSILDLGLNIYILQMWQGESHRSYQTLHFFYAIGYLIGPVLARIFLDDIKGGKASANEVKMMNLHSLPRLIYAYVILCIMFLCVATMWLVLCILHIRFFKSKKSKPRLLREPNPKFKLFALITTSFLMFLIGSIELGYQYLLSTFAFTNYGVGSLQSADITTMFWVFFALGSLLTIVLAGYFHPHFLIILNLAIEILAGILLVFLVERSNQYLALGNSVLGLGASTLFPNTILWFESYDIITHRTMGILLFSEAMAELVIPEILVAVLETSYRSLSYFVIVVPSLYGVIFINQCILFYPTGEKYPTNFSKPGGEITRKQICPVFLYNRIKTEEEQEAAETPPSEESNESIDAVPIHDSPSTKEQGSQTNHDTESKEKTGKKAKEEKGGNPKSKDAAVATDPEEGSEDEGDVAENPKEGSEGEGTEKPKEGSEGKVEESNDESADETVSEDDLEEEAGPKISRRNSA